MCWPTVPKHPWCDCTSLVAISASHPKGLPICRHHIRFCIVLSSLNQGDARYKAMIEALSSISQDLTLDKVRWTPCPTYSSLFPGEAYANAAIDHEVGHITCWKSHQEGIMRHTPTADYKEFEEVEGLCAHCNNKYGSLTLDLAPLTLDAETGRFRLADGNFLREDIEAEFNRQLLSKPLSLRAWPHMGSSKVYYIVEGEGTSK
ncbi:hypothetical protein QBC35DRAFT_281787 [Podospora australis]|uniref:Uncharacterized protein n=1 Tax=Podospora australis TaxID=1536484 RepID=A0AAN7AHJ3_9PEZI|nr:hypothetical protein QBC35DRAFT_281787 [Podospora australis]